MGTDIHVCVRNGSDDILNLAQAEIDALECRWSRFLESSEVSLLNENDGAPNIVSAETYLLVDRAIEGWRMTSGKFDPTMLQAIVDSGYDRDFGEVRDVEASAPVVEQSEFVSTAADIELRADISSVTLPYGSGFDPGGVGKGLAADLVAQCIDSAGALGALVNIGGDLRLIGAGPLRGWNIAIDDPFDRERDPIAVLDLHVGAVATSTSSRRRWTRGGAEMHHLLDPRTGRPAQSRIVSATVVADEGWRAEVLAKSAFLSDIDEALESTAVLGAEAIVVDVDGLVHATAGIDDWLVGDPVERVEPGRIVSVDHKLW